MVVKDYLSGGLKMINLKAFISALKAVWIRRVTQNDKLQNHVSSLGIDFNSLINNGTEYIENCAKICKNIFWKNVLYAWVETLHKETNLKWEHYL